MNSNYFKNLDLIVSQIKKSQSKSLPEKKSQSWRNFLQELHILQDKYETLRDSENALGSFDVEKGEPPLEKKYGDRCSELQYKLLEHIRDFHLQIYSASSSLMNFTKIAISEKYRRNICVNSVSGFYATVPCIFENVKELGTLQESYRFRILITHPEQCKNYDWMTFGPNIIFFNIPKDEPAMAIEIKGNKLQPKTRNMFSLLGIDASNYILPPDTATTLKAFSKVTKCYLKKLTDRELLPRS